MRRRPTILFAIAAAALAVAGSLLSRAAGPAADRASAPPAAAAGAAALRPATDDPAGPAGVVRVAAVGIVNDHDFWRRLAARFEAATGVRVQTVATGNKDGVAALFRRGEVDLVTVPSADTVLSLVVDGWARDPQPWLQTDLLLVGPEADPAGVKGTADLAAAVRKIAAAGAPLLVHDSGGAADVLRDVTQGNGIELPAGTTSFLLDDHQRRVFAVAAERKAYTLIARVPFKSGKLAKAGLTAMVEGDPRLRRPYVLAVADPGKVPGANVAAARRLAAFLRSAETQAWAADFGRGLAGDGPLFFPVAAAASASAAAGDEAAPPAAPAPASRPAAPAAAAGAVLTVDGAVAKSLALDAAAVAALPHRDVTVSAGDGRPAVVYSAVGLLAVLDAAGVSPELRMDPAADPRRKNANLRLAVTVTAADGYAVTFSLAELLPAVGHRDAWLATAVSGRPLPDRDGPLKLIVPDDAKPARSVRGVARVTVSDPTAAPASPAK